MLTVTPASAREQHLPGDFPPPPRNPPAEFAWRALEEVDFGMALVLPEGQLQHANHLARHEICRGRFLRVVDGRLAGGDTVQSDKLANALRLAGTGRRQLVMLQDGKDTLPVACVPLEAGFETRSAPVLLMLGRRAESQRLAITFFARSHGLTPAEENVLRGLCAGHAVQDIANANGTTEGTVRTQIRTLREKTAAPSIRVLLQRVAALPPVVPVSLAGAQAPAAQSGG
jgi:DNA-binding CsgD family transcriptional regulator